MKTNAGFDWLRCVLICFSVSALLVTPVLVRAQEPPPAQPTDAGAPEVQAGPPVKLSGVVLNAASGDPIPRALVWVAGDPRIGALTDQQGRFEVPVTPNSVLVVDVSKPGYHSAAGDGRFPASFERTVRIGSEPLSLEFRLSPDNVIAGRVTLSTGVAAEGIGLQLLKRTTNFDGATWTQALNQQTTPAGEFRFSGLHDGTYLLVTEPELENTQMQEPACAAGSPTEFKGYAPVFYGGSDDLAGASRIVVKGGQTAEANMALTLTTYHQVQIALVHSPAGDNWTFEQALFDHNGQETQYPIREEKGKSLCVYLPDGAYTLWVTASAGGEAQRNATTDAAGTGSSVRFGMLEFSVEGHAERNQRIPLAAGGQTLVHLTYQPGPPKHVAQPSAGTDEAAGEVGEGGPSEPLSDFGGSRVNALGWTTLGRIDGVELDDHTYALDPAPAGAYWMHINSGREGTCVGSATAAGQDLATTPWTVGTAGTGAPIDVVVRTDCASLTLEMPATMAEGGDGEGARFYAYLIPETPSITLGLTAQLDQFANRSQKLEDITPGTYRVFALRTPRAFDVRNPGAVAALGAGQEITLEPGVNTTLVLQEISQ